ncbi:HAD family hydrolase [Microlunatus flavus]|uniref:HAD-superfamily hydrolase, subfamily IIB n=1 Tax=Microlunatus flavus TaxID=1036181 RepID=A0A1H9AD46_9ACTN|nr:HAD family hydrolase [Microlunatus flavus]SEP74666.1 HAD-superfamily hydrolase, subfamily IIB [Microlunatus flavus]
MTSYAPDDRAGWRPRMVALDVDGTVVDRDGVLGPDMADAISKVVAAGVPVVLATGRAWHSTRELVELLGLPAGPTVCSNGAVIVSYPPQEIVQAVTFDPREVIERVESFAPGTLIAVEEIGRGFRMNEHFPEGDLTGELVVQSAAELGAEPVTRIILRDPRRSVDEFVTLAKHLGLQGVTYFVGWSAWLDIAPEGVNKATALAQIAADLGIKAEDVLAAGDGRNDIEMLQWAGRGVALAEAPPEVRAVADAVSVPFLEGGLVPELLRWFG